jgi:asparagine synthase (glutamine-hydrolysing)
MCGIAGRLNINPEKIAKPEEIKRMCRAMRHRGPDGEGYFSSKNFAMGMCRLAIIDLKTGDQPMFNEDKSIAVVCNGEIYNYKSLREKLIKNGHSFRTNSDVEPIVHLYEEKGERFIDDLRGMYVIALWDSLNEKLMIARDRVGKKPLSYFFDGNTFVFASETKALCEDDVVSRSLDVDPVSLGLYCYLQYVPTPYSIFNGIRRLPPASMLILQKGKLNVKQYWSLEYEPKLNLSEEEYLENIKKIFFESVEIRLNSDVPLGIFLSGGIDSSIVVAAASQLYGRKISTYSVGFEESEFNELPYAKIVAQKYGTDHREIILKPDVLVDLPKILWFYDEPLADRSIIPSYFVAKAAKDYVKVILNGDGGDEAFAGYNKYKINPFISFADALSRKNGLWLRSLLSQTYFKGVNGKNFAANFLRRLLTRGINPYLRYIASHGFFDDKPLANILNARGSTFSIEEIVDLIARNSDASKTRNLIDELLSIDFHNYLPNDLLHKMDIATMANSIEARSPFLDSELLSFVARIPAKLKMRNSQQKYLSRKAFKSYLPEEILGRGKMGFGAPVNLWLRIDRDKFVSMITEKDSGCRLYFDSKSIDLLQSHNFVSGGFNETKVWGLLVFEIWWRLYIRKDSIEQISERIQKGYART